MEFLRNEQTSQKIFPPHDQIFAAFDATSLASTRVVIVGQDPYHGPGQANGLAFSVNTDVKIPPSLRNIFRELADDIAAPVPSHGDLSHWSHQGVLLLNSTLTVRSGEAHSHVGHGWETFTDRVIEYISAHKLGCIFILWGSSAQKKAHLINPNRHHIVSAPHPSPLSAHRGFLGSRPFSQTNRLLVESGHTPIDWVLPSAPHR
jgi:uracil-DNA glycosylase